MRAMVPKVFEKLVLSSLPLVPRPLMRRLSSRYIAGERLEDALAKVRELEAAGFSSIMDILGEDNFFRFDPHNPNIATRNALKRAQELLGGQKADVRIYFDPNK